MKPTVYSVLIRTTASCQVFLKNRMIPACLSLCTLLKTNNRFLVLFFPFAKCRDVRVKYGHEVKNKQQRLELLRSVLYSKVLYSVVEWTPATFGQFMLVKSLNFNTTFFIFFIWQHIIWSRAILKKCPRFLAVTVSNTFLFLSSQGNSILKCAVTLYYYCLSCNFETNQWFLQWEIKPKHMTSSRPPLVLVTHYLQGKKRNFSFKICVQMNWQEKLLRSRAIDI